MATLDRLGMTVDVPDGWEGRVTRRADAAAARLNSADPSAGDVSRPVLHMATRALPTSMGDFGGELVERLGSEDIFLAVIDYGPEVAGRGLFASRGVPRLAPSQFGANRMARHVPGRSACQHFFSDAGRGFCLYAVVGAHSRRMSTVPRLATVAAGLRMGAIG